MKYTITLRLPSGWELLTKTDNFAEATITTNETLSALARRLASDGFQLEDRWIMPAAIMVIEPD